MIPQAFNIVFLVPMGYPQGFLQQQFVSAPQFFNFNISNSTEDNDHQSQMPQETKIEIEEAANHQEIQENVQKQAQNIQQENCQQNIKNIIPNLCRKLVTFLASKKCKEIIHTLYPNLKKPEIMKIFVCVNSLKSMIGCGYIGKKNLKKLWFDPKNTPKYTKSYQILRKLSKFYLQNQCVSSILTSKRMKPSLKSLHLQYRRKFLFMIKELS